MSTAYDNRQQAPFSERIAQHDWGEIDGDPKDPGFRRPPFNIEAEQALLGAILVNNEVYHRVSGKLEPWHFFEPLHGRIYTKIGALISANGVADPITLKPHFERDPTILEQDIPNYLVMLARATATVIDAAAFADQIVDMAMRRGLILVGDDMVNHAYDAASEADAREQLESAERNLYQLASEGRHQSGFKSFDTAAGKAIEMVAAAYKRGGELAGLPTGFKGLDRIMGGLQKSDLVIIAGRPGMGKSALACNIAFNITRKFAGEVGPDGDLAITSGGRAAFFSLEMSADQLALRLLAQHSKVSSAALRKGQIEEEHFASVREAAEELMQMPFYIDDTGGLSISALVSRARRQKRQTGLDLIVVDYLQLLTGSGKKAQENRVQEISEITVTLKSLAKELDVPVIALAQLSRQVEQRPDKRPQLSDLRESGSIEQDADSVLFVYREEYYKRLEDPEPRAPGPNADETAKAAYESEYDAWEERMKGIIGKAEIIIGKNRHGPTDAIPVYFDAQFTEFKDIDYSHNGEDY